MSLLVRKDESGAALLLALLTIMLLSAVAAVLVNVTTTETMIAAAHRHAQETSYAAESAVERALRDLAELQDWSLALLPSPANVQSTFVDGQLYPVTPAGTQLDVGALTLARQAESDTHAGPSVFSNDSPRWRLYAHAALADIVPVGMPVQPAYVLVWVADDGADGDGDASLDTNGRMLVFADAYGAGGTRRSVEAAIEKTPEGMLKVLTWRK
jgi:hypothetical protein